MVLVVVILAAIVAVGGYVYITSTGLRSQPDPGAFETRVARGLRSLAVPAHIRDFPNPVPVSDENVGKGMTHFASYCAVCHGNGGFPVMNSMSGQTSGNEPVKSFL